METEPPTSFIQWGNEEIGLFQVFQGLLPRQLRFRCEGVAKVAAEPG